MDKEIILPKVDISKTCPSSVSVPQTNGRSKARFLILSFIFILCVHCTLLSMNFSFIVVHLAEIKVQINHDMILLDIDMALFFILMDRKR